MQDLLGQQMQQVYADRIARQRAARAHDALMMKVLSHAADQQQAQYQRFTDTRPAATPAPFSRTDEIAFGDSGRVTAVRTRTRTVRVGMSPWRAFFLGLLAAALATGGLVAGEIYLRKGVLVVSSTPPGAEVLLDGRPAAAATPAVLDDVNVSVPHTVVIQAPGRRPVTVEVTPKIGQLVRRVHGDLASVVGSVTVESDPPGAELRLDGRPVGSTPMTLSGVRMDERHRIDLTLPGHEFDQFVVLPEKDGVRFVRKLVALGAAKPRNGGRRQ